MHLSIHAAFHFMKIYLQIPRELFSTEARVVTLKLWRQKEMMGIEARNGKKFCEMGIENYLKSPLVH